MKLKLIMTVGLPRSGKSTWARAQGHPIVNPDSIRLALHGQAYIQSAEPMVWAIARFMVDSLFLAGHDTVILDATNVTRKRRDDWASDKWEREFHVVDTSLEECVRRAKECDFPVEVIKEMYENYEGVEDDEV